MSFWVEALAWPRGPPGLAIGWDHELIPGLNVGLQLALRVASGWSMSLLACLGFVWRYLMANARNIHGAEMMGDSRPWLVSSPVKGATWFLAQWHGDHMHCLQPILGFEIQICGFMAIAVHGRSTWLCSTWYSKRVGLRMFAQYAPYIGGERGSSYDTWISRTILIK